MNIAAMTRMARVATHPRGTASTHQREAHEYRNHEGDGHNRHDDGPAPDWVPRAAALPHIQRPVRVERLDLHREQNTEGGKGVNAVHG
jgi:hypothetical protein